MATMSFFKNVDIKDKRAAKSLILALESAKDKQSVEVRLSRPCHDADDSMIQAIFGKKV